jgi:hypothetical protein
MKHLLLALLLTLPAMADRQLTVTWDKYPERNEIVVACLDYQVDQIIEKEK